LIIAGNRNYRSPLRKNAHGEKRMRKIRQLILGYAISPSSIMLRQRCPPMIRWSKSRMSIKAAES
jgi:hypothetical protein